MRTDFFNRACSDGTKGNDLKLKEGRFRLDIRKKFFMMRVAQVFYDTLAQVARRGGRYPIPGNIHGQVGWVSEQPDLPEDVPAHCRGVGLDDL